MNRLLITGGSSYLGQHLTPLAGEFGEVFYTYFQQDPLDLPGAKRLDLRDGTAVRELVQALRPTVIIHLAGSNRDATTMDAVICRGTAHIVRAAGETGAWLIYLSTDVIFDGEHAPYSETATPAARHAYGRAKVAAERMVSHYPAATIVRTSLIYGLEKMDRGTEWMVEMLHADRPVTLFTDQMRNPIDALSLSRACLELSTLKVRGILHVAGAQCLSRAEFALRMLDWWGIGNREKLHLGLCDPERWPRNCCLDISRAHRLLKTDLPGVDEVLRAAVSSAGL